MEKIATGYRQGVAIGERSVIRTQPQVGFGHIVGLAQATDEAHLCIKRGGAHPEPQLTQFISTALMRLACCAAR